MTRSDVLTIAVTLLAVAVTFLVSPPWGWAFLAGGLVVLGIYFVMGRGSIPWPTGAVVGVPVCALILVCCFLAWKVLRPQPKQDAPLKTAAISPQAPATEPLPVQPPTPAPHKKAAAKQHPVQTAQPPPVVYNNAPQGIANSGTIQQATVTNNNFGPVDRHLNGSQIDAIDILAASLPESAAQWLSIETAHDGDSNGYANEMLKIFSGRIRVNQRAFVIRLIDEPSDPRGVFVLVTNASDPNFDWAQKIADQLHGVGIPVTFSTATGLTPGQVKIVVFRQ